jgi:hypothetical protein
MASFCDQKRTQNTEADQHKFLKFLVYCTHEHLITEVFKKFIGFCSNQAKAVSSNSTHNYTVISRFVLPLSEFYR